MYLFGRLFASGPGTGSAGGASVIAEGSVGAPSVGIVLCGTFGTPKLYVVKYVALYTLELICVVKYIALYALQPLYNRFHFI